VGSNPSEKGTRNKRGSVAFGCSESVAKCELGDYGTRCCSYEILEVDLEKMSLCEPMNVLVLDSNIDADDDNDGGL